MRERSSCVDSHGEERKRTREESRIKKMRKDECGRHEERDDEENCGSKPEERRERKRGKRDGKRKKKIEEKKEKRIVF